MKTIQADLDIVKVVRTPEEAEKGITVPAPQPGEARDLRVHVSTKTGPANFTIVAKRTGERSSNCDGTAISEDYRLSPAVPSAGLGSLDADAEVPLTFGFMLDELNAYVTYRSEGLAKKSQDWVKRAAQALWESTRGEISQTSMAALRTFTLDKYSSIDSHRKVLGFATAFLKHLAKTRFEPRYQSFDIFLEPPKTVRVRKAITERIVTREDIVQALGRIDAAEREGNITPSKVRNYRAFTLLAAYTGLRPSTIQRLTVGQFRTAMKEDKPVLHVLAEQEKNRVEHYVPIHPVVIGTVSAVLTHDFEETGDDEPLFMFNSFEKWLERQKIPLPRVRDPAKAHLWLSDFRKFAEQFGDIIGWDATNRKYVLAHGMTGVDWEHYKHPLPEDVYDTYMRFWWDVEIGC
jgi:integrase